MFERIASGEIFLNPFTGKVFKVKKIDKTFMLLEEAGNGNHQIMTEMGTIINFYQKLER